MRIIQILISLLLLTVTLQAQNTNFVAQAPRQVVVGQRFQLSFTLNNEGSNFISPEITNFDILNGPMISTGQNIINVQGKLEYSTTLTYTFILEATTPGTFTIAPAVITSKGKRYLSNALNITVTSQPRQAQQQQNNNQSPRQQQQIRDNVGNDIMLKAVVDNPNPYQGEMVVVTYKLYTPTNQLQVNPPEKIPSYPGFWAQDLLKDATQYKQYTEVIGGKKFIVAELRKAALYPQKSGALTIEPLVQDVVYQIKVKSRNPFADDPFFGNDPFFKNFIDDSFFGSDVQNVSKTLKSNAITVNVKPLPVANRPLEFSGAVGQFNMTAVFDRTEAATNDGITLKVSITGNGNLNLIEKPTINFPPDFEVYDPKIVDNFNNKGGTSGTRTFEYLIIPRTAGNFSIAPIEFSYFNPNTKDYTVVSSQPFTLKIAKGNGKTGEQVSQSDVKYLGNDIHYLKDTPLGLISTGNYFYGSTLYYIILSVVVALFILFLIIFRREMQMRSDKSMMQMRKATGIAAKRLKKARKFMDEGRSNEFHDEISLALWGYISHKFNVPLSMLSMETAREQLESRKVNPHFIEQFLKVLSDCNFARYAPANIAPNMNELYNHALKAITETEQSLKK